MSHTDFNILDYVKSSLGIYNNFQDKLLQNYIDDVKLFMIDAGVDSTIVNSLAAAGCITKGVNDLWNYNAGSTDFSPFFYKRVIQLSLQEVGGEDNE